MDTKFDCNFISGYNFYNFVRFICFYLFLMVD